MQGSACWVPFVNNVKLVKIKTRNGILVAEKLPKKRAHLEL